MGELDSKNELKNIVGSYTKHWKWFLVASFISLFFAFIYLRYTIKEYEVRAQIQIIQENNSTSELSALQDLDVFSGTSKQVEDEIQILTSRSNYIDVVKELGTNIRVFALGKVISSEIYQNVPFKINFIAPDSIVRNADYSFFVEFITDTTFGFSESEDEPLKVHSYGKGITTEIGDIIITPNVISPKELSGNRFRIKIDPIVKIANTYKNSITLLVTDEKSNILDITMASPLPNKAMDIINKLIEIYNRNAVEEKKRIADTTSDFINNRIELISGTLTSVDKDAEELLTEKGMTSTGAEVGAAIQGSAGSRQNLENARVQLQMVSGLKEYVNESNGYEEMPVVEVGSGALSQATVQYNQLVAERKRLLQSADEQNPMIVNLDEQLDGLKSTMQSSLNSLEQNVGMSVNSLQNQFGRIQGTIYSAPENQRELRNITRKQETTESLYLYLLQKREESQISFASAAPKSKIIDYAYLASTEPIKPKEPIIFLASIILGLLVPFSAIYVKELMDTKIHNKQSLESIVKNVPILGEIPKLNKRENKVIINDDRSVLAEALRIIRTNLDFLIRTKNLSQKGKNNVVFVTSSVPGEGKTFVSTNLSMILASTNKKVLLIGGDVRNPKLYTFFSGNDVNKLKSSERQKDAGLTEYLINDSLTINNIIRPMLVHSNTIDVIYSGKIPPNPSELLMNERMKELLNQCSELYDYVIVDTAPLMVVTDTLLIAPFADHIIYVTRAGVTEKNVIQFPLDLKEEGKLKGISFVVNDVNLDDLGYGGKYGYGYGKISKKWWKF